MLCCMRRTKQVEKNDDVDQKIEQDGIKPEDKAHKAATKIQASFRGHITRKKLKGEKKGDAQTDVEAGEKKEEVLANGLADGKAAITEVAPIENALPAEGSKGGSTPADEKQAEGTADTGSEQPAPKATPPVASSEEKPTPAATELESATKASTDNSPSLKADEAQVKEEPKQGTDVPATVAAAVTPTAAEDATAKATAQPQTDTAESSQTEEKTDAVEETKPSESAQQEEAKEDECKADQENA